MLAARSLSCKHAIHPQSPLAVHGIVSWLHCFSSASLNSLVMQSPGPYNCNLHLPIHLHAFVWLVPPETQALHVKHVHPNTMAPLRTIRSVCGWVAAINLSAYAGTSGCTYLFTFFPRVDSWAGCPRTGLGVKRAVKRWGACAW